VLTAPRAWDRSGSGAESGDAGTCKTQAYLPRTQLKNPGKRPFPDSSIGVQCYSRVALLRPLLHFACSEQRRRSKQPAAAAAARRHARQAVRCSACRGKQKGGWRGLRRTSARGRGHETAMQRSGSPTRRALCKRRHAAGPGQFAVAVSGSPQNRFSEDHGAARAAPITVRRGFIAHWAVRHAEAGWGLPSPGGGPQREGRPRRGRTHARAHLAQVAMLRVYLCSPTQARPLRV
jgi:hypothetical protein